MGAILVGLELMNDQIIVRNEFFVTIEEYCCFSGTDREEHIKNLLQTYCYYKNFQTADQFLEEIQKLYKQFIELKITDRVL